jgi:hypothetical protein
MTAVISIAVDQLSSLDPDCGLEVPFTRPTSLLLSADRDIPIDRKSVGSPGTALPPSHSSTNA